MIVHISIAIPVALGSSLASIILPTTATFWKLKLLIDIMLLLQRLLRVGSSASLIKRTFEISLPAPGQPVFPSLDSLD